MMILERIGAMEQHLHASDFQNLLPEVGFLEIDTVFYQNLEMLGW